MSLNSVYQIRDYSSVGIIYNIEAIINVFYRTRLIVIVLAE